MRKEGHKVGEYAIIELPVAQAGRFIRLPDKDGKNYLMYLDDVVRYCLPLIFHGMNYKHFEAYAFKFHGVTLAEQPPSAGNQPDGAQQYQYGAVRPLDGEREEDGLYDATVHGLKWRFRLWPQRY